MIIEQNIEVTDRKSLQKVKAYVHANRNERLASFSRSTEAFQQKWSMERVARAVGYGAVRHVVVDQLVGALSGNNDPNAEEKDEKQSTWKSMILEFLELVVPKVVARFA